MKTLREIEEEVRRLGAIIDAEGNLLPTYGGSEDFARPHIEADLLGYHYVIVERGQEQSRYTTSDLDGLLYQIFRGVTFTLACEYELRHRVERQDHRRILFQRQLELLARLNENWGLRRRTEQEATLRDHPFDDMSGERVILTNALRESGQPPQDAWRIACERYPLPTRQP